MLIPTRRQFVSGALAAAIARPLEAATPSRADLVEDLALFEEAYSALHPGLGRYLGAERFGALIDAERGRLAKGPADNRALLLALARLTAAVRCGHSYPNPVNQSDTVLHGLLDGPDRIPFAFRWLNGEMIVTRALRSGVPLPPGDRIDSIDGTPTRELLRRLLPLARADGANQGKRVALMEVDRLGRFNAFDVYRPLVSPVSPDGTVRVMRSGKPIELPAMSDAERQKASAADSTEGWRFRIEAGVGQLTMPTWALYNSPFDWRAFLASAFDNLVAERAHGLVIDLRANEGGQDCGDVVLAHLAAAPIAMPHYERRVRYHTVPASLRPHLDTWDKSFFDWGAAAQPSHYRGFYSLLRDADDFPGALLAPAAPRFAGKTAVLVSPTCSSATFQFALAARTAGLARLFGETTGGNLRGINGGAFFFLRLPASGLEVDLPLIGYFATRQQPDAGLAPDVRIVPTAEDISGGRDRALTAARVWISS